MTSPVKRAFKYRFYPADAQAAELSRTFGRVRKVYNLALVTRTEAWTLRRERVNYNQTSALEYKATWYGREVIAVDRWFPSSKLCSVCGSVRDTMPLRVRSWTCGCGATHDRDVNAARNILAAGLAVSACGAGVRPQRSSPGGRSAMKQEALRREL